MSSPSKASGSDSANEKDNDASAGTWSQQPESDKDTDSTSDDSQSDNKSSDNTSSGDTPSENNTTKEDDETNKALAQEDLDDNEEFSQLIGVLIEWRINETEANIQQDYGPRQRDLFAEHMREEALILDTLAGPNATAAERRKVGDEAAAVRLRLADQTVEGVAESVARDKPKRDARKARRRAARAVWEAKREAAQYEQELASMRRLVEYSLEFPDDLPGVLGVVQWIALEPFRQGKWSRGSECSVCFWESKKCTLELDKC